jgi:hypothetical protein
MKPEDSLTQTGTSDDLRDGLRKERRLLIIVSLVFLAHLLFGLTVDRSAETLGFRFEVRDPEDVWLFVGAVWLWALLRYWLYFHDYNDADMAIDLKRREYRAHEWIVIRRIRRIKEPEEILGHKPNRRSKIEVDLGEAPKPGFNQRLIYERAHVSVATPDAKGGARSSGSTMPQAFGPIEVRLLRCFAWMHLFVTTRYGTEYFVPFILGAAPALVIAWRHRYLFGGC